MENVNRTYNPSSPNISPSELRIVLHSTLKEIKNFENEVLAKPYDFQDNDYKVLQNAIDKCRESLLTYEKNNATKGDRYLEVNPDLTEGILSAIQTILEKGGGSENYLPALNALREFENDLRDVERRRSTEQDRKFKSELFTILDNTSKTLAGIKAEDLSQRENPELIEALRAGHQAIESYKSNEKVKGKWSGIDLSITHAMRDKINSILEKNQHPSDTVTGSKHVALKALETLQEDLNDFELQIKKDKQTKPNLYKALQKTAEKMEALSNVIDFKQGQIEDLISDIKDCQEELNEFILTQHKDKYSGIDPSVLNRIMLAMRALMEKRVGEKLGSFEKAQEYLSQLMDSLRDFERLKKDFESQKRKVQDVGMDSL